MTTINAILNKSMEEIFKVIATKFSGEDFTADDIMEFMKEGCTTSDSDTETKKKKKTKKLSKPSDPNKPKRPTNTYMIFCKSKREENPDHKYTASELGDLWKLVSDEDKEKIWEVQAQKLKEEYEEKMKAYNSNQ